MSGRSIIVTRVFGTLYRIVAAAFAREGDKVARIDFPLSAADSVAGALNMPGIDLTDAAAGDRAIAQVADRHGGIDALVTIVGVFP